MWKKQKRVTQIVSRVCIFDWNLFSSQESIQGRILQHACNELPLHTSSSHESSDGVWGSLIMKRGCSLHSLSVYSRWFLSYPPRFLTSSENIYIVTHWNMGIWWYFNSNYAASINSQAWHQLYVFLYMSKRKLKYQRDWRSILANAQIHPIDRSV